MRCSDFHGFSAKSPDLDTRIHHDSYGLWVFQAWRSQIWMSNIFISDPAWWFFWPCSSASGPTPNSGPTKQHLSAVPHGGASKPLRDSFLPSFLPSIHPCTYMHRRHAQTTCTDDMHIHALACTYMQVSMHALHDITLH